MRIGQQQRGFTILEVLVAFVLASTLLTLILSGFANGLSGLSHADRLVQAALVAESQLAELGVLEPVQEGEYSGTSEGGVDAYQWRVQIKPLEWGYAAALSEQGAVLLQIEVEVVWTLGRKERSYVVSTLRVQHPGEVAHDA